MINNNANELLNKDSLIIVYDDNIDNIRFYTLDFYTSSVDKTIPGIVFDSIQAYNKFCLPGEIVQVSFIQPGNVFTIHASSWFEWQDHGFSIIFKIQIGDGKEYIVLTYSSSGTIIEKLLAIVLRDINKIFKYTSIEAYINETFSITSSINGE